MFDDTKKRSAFSERAEESISTQSSDCDCASPIRNDEQEMKKPVQEQQQQRQRPPSQCRQRTSSELFLGKVFILLTLISFIFIGVILNLVQLLLTLTIRFSNNRTWRHWHKQLHGQLVYAIFAQPVFLLYAWPRWDLSIVVEDVRLIDEVKRNIFGIIIANHTFELDWMTCFVLADQLGNMGNYKCFSKDELKWLPIIGWTFWMADLIYVKRDWKHDRLRIDDKLNQLLDYNQILLGIFAEGTRWTQEKHEDAIGFAKSRNIEPYKHHLFPRPRGFNYTLRHYLRLGATTRSPQSGSQGGPTPNTGPVRVFNLEIVMPDRPNFRTFLEGGLLRAAVYAEEVHLSDDLREEALNACDEDHCPKLTKLLQDIFRRKDQLVDEFNKNNQTFPIKSPRSGHFPVRRPVAPFVYWLTSMSLTYGTFLYLAQTLFAESVLFWSLVVIFMSSGLLLLKRIERESLPTKLRKREQTRSENGARVETNSDDNDNATTMDGHHRARRQAACLESPVARVEAQQVTAGKAYFMSSSPTAEDDDDNMIHDTAKACSGDDDLNGCKSHSQAC